MALDYISIAQAAKLAGMSRRRLQILIEEGRGPQYETVMGRKGFMPDQIAAWNKTRIKLPRGRKPNLASA